MRFLSFLCCLILLTQGSYGSVKKHLIQEEISAVVIDSDSGIVKISESSETQPPKVLYTTDGMPKGSELSFETKNKTLFVTFKKPMSFVGVGSVDFTLKLPKSTDISVKLGQGDIEIKDMDQNLSVESGSSSIDLDAPLKSVSIKSGQSKVSAKRLAGDINVDIGSGKVDLQYSDLPLKTREINLKAGSAFALIKVPKDSHVGVGFKENIFATSVHSEFPNTPNSPHYKVEGRFGAGSVKIQKN